MPNQTIPITLTPGVPPPDAKWVTLAELIALVCSNTAASIRADITFIPQVSNDPVAYDGNLIFNIIQRVFKAWDIGTGKYVAVTENVVGDLKDSFNGNDDVAHGWVVLNGRLISDVSGVSSAQTANLQSLFGTAATTKLPIVLATHTNGLPPSGSFSGIPIPPSISPVLQPAAGIIAPGLTFSNPATGPEAQALANNTEILRSSASDSFNVVTQIQTVAESLLVALNNTTTPPLYAKVFCGYP